MKYGRWDKFHLKNVKSETNNPAILNDIINNEFASEFDVDHSLSPIQDIVKNQTDGKTWQDEEEER